MIADKREPRRAGRRHRRAVAHRAVHRPAARAVRAGGRGGGRVSTSGRGDRFADYGRPRRVDGGLQGAQHPGRHRPVLVVPALPGGAGVVRARHPADPGPVVRARPARCSGWTSRPGVVTRRRAGLPARSRTRSRIALAAVPGRALVPGRGGAGRAGVLQRPAARRRPPGRAGGAVRRRRRAAVPGRRGRADPAVQLPRLRGAVQAPGGHLLPARRGVRRRPVPAAALARPGPRRAARPAARPPRRGDRRAGAVDRRTVPARRAAGGPSTPRRSRIQRGRRRAGAARVLAGLPATAAGRGGGPVLGCRRCRCPTGRRPWRPGRICCCVSSARRRRPSAGPGLLERLRRAYRELGRRGRTGDAVTASGGGTAT